jgi:hypothetical protein
MRLVQLQRSSGETRVALVDGDTLRLLDDCDSVYDLARQALRTGFRLGYAVRPGAGTLPYDAVYRLESDWRLLPPLTHPEPARCLVSGTGLTHKASADNRQAMHQDAADLSDSMRMYLAGVEGGRPEPGAIGVAPEWFYKGCGTTLRAHGEPLIIPSYACDGGEEPEVAGLYIVDDEGRPRRIGMAQANEFSDHVLEKQNYLYLAHSKLRNCAIGPELVVDPAFNHVPGAVTVERAGEVLWSRAISTGEDRMSHSVANLEHHHFKYESHRRPGDVHIHFYGADAFSFGAGIRLEEGDVTVVAFEKFGRPLRNPVHVDRTADALVAVAPL